MKEKQGEKERETRRKRDRERMKDRLDEERKKDKKIIRGSFNKFPDFYVWALLLIVHI